MSIGNLGVAHDTPISSADNQQAIIDHLNGKSGVSWAFFPLAEGSGATLSDISGNVTDNLTLNQACNWVQQAAGEPDGCFNVNNANQAYVFDNPATLTSLYSLMNTNDVGDGNYLVLFNIFTTSKTGSAQTKILTFGNGNAVDNDAFYEIGITTTGIMQLIMDEGVAAATLSYGAVTWDADAWNTFALHFRNGSNEFYSNSDDTPATNTGLDMLTIDVPQTTSRGVGLACRAAGSAASSLLGVDTGAREVYLGGLFILKTDYSITSLIQPIVEGWYDQNNPFKLPQVLLQV